MNLGGRGGGGSVLPWVSVARKPQAFGSEWRKLTPSLQLVKPIMRKHGWYLPTFAEFYPTQTNLLGQSPSLLQSRFPLKTALLILCRAHDRLPPPDNCNISTSIMCLITASIA